MSCVGECFTGSDLVNGVVCSVRKNGDRIAIWTNSCEREQMEAIGLYFKEACGFTEDDRFKFEAHPKDSHGKSRELYSV